MNTKTILFGLGFVAVCWTLPSQAQITVIPVAGFNAPVGGGFYTTLVAGASFGSGGAWNVSKGNVDVIGTSFWQTPDGNQNVDLDGSIAGNSIGGISTNFIVPASGTVEIDFWLAANPGPLTLGPAVKTVAVSFGGQQQIFTADNTGKTVTNMGWIKESAFFAGVSAGSKVLSFTSLDPLTPTAFAGPVIGTVTASVTASASTPVPEASAFGALASLGIIGLIVTKMLRSRFSSEAVSQKN